MAPEALHCRVEHGFLIEFSWSCHPALSQNSSFASCHIVRADAF
jgi:hypothetical protein